MSFTELGLQILSWGVLVVQGSEVAGFGGDVAHEDGQGALTHQAGDGGYVHAATPAGDGKGAAKCVRQVWAQAMQLWRQDPRGYRFDPAEATAQNKNAENHMAPDILADMLARTYIIDPRRADETGWRVTSSEILDALRTYSGLSRGSDGSTGRQLARTLKKEWGIVGKRSNGATIYAGLMRKDQPTGG